MRQGTRRTSLFAPTRDRALVLAWLLGCIVVALVAIRIPTRMWMIDADTFWRVWHLTPMYDLAPNTPGAYLYSPVFAQALWPLTHLPWAAFAALWLVCSLVAYVWLMSPAGWLWGVPLALLAVEDVTIGNTAWLLALACVLGMRRPALWAIPTVLKVSTGVGVVWFLARRDYRAVAEAMLATAAVVALSWWAAPDLWHDWLGFLQRQPGDPVLYLRVASAFGLVWWAARTDRAWLVPVAMVVATPVLMVYGLGMLCAIPRLLTPEQLVRAKAPFGPPAAFARRVLDIDEPGHA